MSNHKLTDVIKTIENEPEGVTPDNDANWIDIKIAELQNQIQQEGAQNIAMEEEK